MIIESSANKVIHIKFDSQYEAASTMMRLQEFYESPFPEIRGNFFTVEQYMDIYAKHCGNFTYTSDWNGFNVPGGIVSMFFDNFDDLLEKEIRLHTLLEPFLDKTDGNNFYLIGTHDNRDIDHEYAHALYYLNFEYRQHMTDLMDEMDSSLLERFSGILGSNGYTDEVILDEVQAYLATSSLRYLRDRFNIEFDLDLRLDFNQVFNTYRSK